MRIAVISDTHGSFAAIDRCILRAGDVDAWFHLGDYASDARYLRDKVNVPVYSVYGNCDGGMGTACPEEIFPEPQRENANERVVTIGGVRVFLCHGHDYDVDLAPFTLSYRAEELDASEFGNLVHDALEAWGQGELKDSTDADAIATTLEEKVDAILVERFGLEIPAIVALQGESVKRRLRRFAALQAARAADGWRVMATERKMKVAYGHTLVAGRCDRIDFNERTGEWCVVDYKTWDSAARAAAFETKKDGTRVWKSLQLPLYCAMLDADHDFPEAKRERITASYCILAKTAADTCYSESFSGADVPDAEAKVKELVDGIERGVFWPAADTSEWRWDFADWIFNSPEESVDPAWIADQLRRIEVGART